MAKRSHGLKPIGHTVYSPANSERESQEYSSADHPTCRITEGPTHRQVCSISIKNNSRTLSSSPANPSLALYIVAAMIPRRTRGASLHSFHYTSYLAKPQAGSPADFSHIKSPRGSKHQRRIAEVPFQK